VDLVVCLLFAGWPKHHLMGCGYWEIAAHKRRRRRRKQHQGLFTAKSEPHKQQKPHK